MKQKKNFLKVWNFVENKNKNFLILKIFFSFFGFSQKTFFQNFLFLLFTYFFPEKEKLIYFSFFFLLHFFSFLMNQVFQNKSLLSLILNYFSLKELITCLNQVCSFWNKTIQEENLVWKNTKLDLISNYSDYNNLRKANKSCRLVEELSLECKSKGQYSYGISALQDKLRYAEITFYDFIEKEFENFTNLKSLKLKGNYYFMNRMLFIISYLAPLVRKLKSIDFMCENRNEVIQHVTPLSCYPYLTKIKLDSCSIELQELKHLSSSLEYLNLERVYLPNLSDLQNLEYLPKLKGLNMDIFFHNNQKVEEEDFKLELNELKELNLNDSIIKYALSYFYDIPFLSLTKASLNCCKEIYSFYLHSDLNIEFSRLLFFEQLRVLKLENIPNLPISLFKRFKSLEYFHLWKSVIIMETKEENKDEDQKENLVTVLSPVCGTTLKEFNLGQSDYQYTCGNSTRISIRMEELLLSFPSLIKLQTYNQSVICSSSNNIQFPLFNSKLELLVLKDLYYLKNMDEFNKFLEKIQTNLKGLYVSPLYYKQDISKKFKSLLLTEEQVEENWVNPKY